MVVCLVGIRNSDAFLGGIFGGSTSPEEAFLSWFKDNGGMMNGVGLGDFPNMGRGVKATGDIKSGNEVMRIPTKIIFSQSSLLKSNDPMHVKIAKAIASDDLAVVAALLLEKQRDTNSKFYEYLQVLPKYIPNLSYYNTESLKHLQSPTLEKDALEGQYRNRNNYKIFTDKVLINEKNIKYYK